jgi:hypothetical protein
MDLDILPANTPNQGAELRQMVMWLLVQCLDHPCLPLWIYCGDHDSARSLIAISVFVPFLYIKLS